VPSIQNITSHPQQTARRTLTYEFTPKHHGRNATASCWLTALTLVEEFEIFDRADGIVVAAPADNRQVADARGNLYGYEVLAGGSQHLREIGTWDQQMAEYPVQQAGTNWHGYPIWPVGPLVPQKYQGQRCRPAPEVFDRMVQIGDITSAQRKRLKKGDWL
jgi:hypothetical protein